MEKNIMWMQQDLFIMWISFKYFIVLLTKYTNKLYVFHSITLIIKFSLSIKFAESLSANLEW